MAEQQIPSSHPLVALTGLLSAELDAVAEVDPIYMTPAEQETALLGLQRSRERIAELELRVLAATPVDAVAPGARSTGHWLAHETNQAVGLVRSRERLAHDLQRYDVLRAAFAAGEVTEAQARVVVQVLDDLPSDLEPAVLAKAERVMVDDCSEWKPQELRRIAERLLEVLAPDIADAAEEARLRKEEERARARTRLKFTRLGTGATRISATVPDSVAAQLKSQLHAFASHRRDHVAGDGTGPRVDPATGKRTPYEERLGQAFCELIEKVDAGRLPSQGGSSTSLVVTIGLDKLKAGLGAGVLSTGQTISAGEARRLACQAGIVPAVMGSRSQVLDLGRRGRFFTKAQRVALEIRDKHCRAEGCDMPAAWCEAHHKNPWASGGRTDLKDGVLLCSMHHHLVHGQTYHHTWLPDGTLRFHRRT